MDFAKAFDHIDHNILLRKLSSMDVPQAIINWIANFLTEREQRVKLGVCTSGWQKLNGGVPQVTVLGPILFLVMINDLLSGWQDRWKYVDDTNVAECIRPNCPSHLQEVVNDITTWTMNNNMKLNITKCKELIIDFSKEKKSLQPLTVNGNPIKLVESEKILGVVVQNNLKWNLHVENIVKKSSKRIYMLRLLKRSKADMKTLVVLYTTTIRPILEYACQVWHFNIQKFLSDDIERVQKRALRIIVPNSSYNEALEITGITTLYDRRESLCYEFFRQNINSDKMTDLFPETVTLSYDLRLPRKFNNYKCKTDRFKHSFFPEMIFKVNSGI